MGFSYCLLLKLHVEWKYAKMECFTTYFLDVSLKINLLILLYKYYLILYATLKKQLQRNLYASRGYLVHYTPRFMGSRVDRKLGWRR